ncbi:MAG: bifunctional oligoribonuclease/PAP phosphatase NrnA [Acidobacteriia bacterium]|nr:bifunctional oligoribonuclease/PAP phosphatase NrnA [Terriglobia bacterium]
MDQFEQVLQRIEQGSHFLVTSHARPDGDAVGSALAMGQVLRKMGKTAEVVLRDSVPVIYQPLPFSQTITHSPEVTGNFDAAIILECDSVQRTRLHGLEKYFQINIDHHTSSKAFADINWIDPRACAVAEMVFRLALAARVCVTPEIATCLYTAVLTDTGAFSYSATNAHTFELARCLVEHGADPSHIAQSVYFASPISKIRLLGAALRGLHQEGAVTWMSVTRQDMLDCGALDEDTEGLVNYALGIAGIEVAVFFREVAQTRVRVSIRSKGAVNVAELAEKFGGGGHECASGFSTEGPLSDAVVRVLAELRSRMPATNTKPS